MNAAVVIIAGAALYIVALTIGAMGMKNLLEWKSNAWCAAAWLTLIPALGLIGFGVWLTTL